MEQETRPQRFKRLRNQKGLTLEQLAQKVGMTRGGVHKWETGDTTNIDNEVLQALAELYATDIPYILWGPDRKPPPPLSGTPSTDSSTMSKLRGQRKA